MPDAGWFESQTDEGLLRGWSGHTSGSAVEDSGLARFAGSSR